MDFNEFKKTLPKKVSRKFTARYYGTRDLKIFPIEFLDYVDECPSFIDVTAGGGRFIYDQALKGKTVGANDRCYYSYLALSAVLEKKTFEDNWFERLYTLTLSGNQCNCGVVGYFSSNGKKSFVNDTLRSYIDEICMVYTDDPFVLYAIGKAIRSIFTYRGLGWCPQTPFDMPSTLVSIEYFHKVFMKAAWTTYLYASQLQKKHRVFYLDALDAIETGFSDSLIRDSMVYADPAWPWEKGSNNPYAWFTNDLSSILQQHDASVEYWPRDADIILEDIYQWGYTALKRGAKYFTICGQDTNFPSLAIIRAYMSQKFNEVKWVEVKDQSKAAHRIYTTGWGVYSQ